jgi:hypothetical protein
MLLQQNRITFTEKAHYYKKIKLPVNITLADTNGTSPFGVAHSLQQAVSSTVMLITGCT